MRQTVASAVFVTIAALSLAGRAAAPPSKIESRFLYALSSTTGTLPYSWASLSMDREAMELYVVSGGIVDIFNDAGMSVYDFANETGYGQPFAIAPIKGGDLYLLTNTADGWAVVRTNFRGDVIGKVEITGLPDDFAAEFRPSTLVTSGGKIFLADKARMRVAVAGLDGKVASTVDFVDLMSIGEKQRADASMRAFDVDASGNMLFTISALFSAYVYSPDGKLRGFGMKGSTPGKFNVVGGITADESGHIYVTDVLRCAVMVFDASDFSFLGEFGERGYYASDIVAPLNVAAANGKVYVTQSRGGVKVFGVQFQ